MHIKMILPWKTPREYLLCQLILGDDVLRHDPLSDALEELIRIQGTRDYVRDTKTDLILSQEHKRRGHTLVSVSVGSRAQPSQQIQPRQQHRAREAQSNE